MLVPDFDTVILQSILCVTPGLTRHIVRVVLRVIFTSTRYAYYYYIHRVPSAVP
jgi:hypothetical protein